MYKEYKRKQSAVSVVKVLCMASVFSIYFVEKKYGAVGNERTKD